MIPLKSIIKGFGPHEDLTIDWASLPSPTSIVADLGTGKTWLVEAGIYAALFGKFIWYNSGPIYHGLTQGGTGKGSLYLEFSQSGVKYSAKRFVSDSGKTQVHEAILTNMDTGEEIAGPKVGDFKAKIIALIGDADTAAATWFLSQNVSGDLVGTPGSGIDLVSHRRKVFNNLIGGSELDKKEAAIGEVIKGYNADKLHAKAQLSDIDTLRADLGIAKTKKDDVYSKILDKMAIQSVTEGNVESITKALAAVAGPTEALQITISQYETSKTALEHAISRRDKARVELKGTQAEADTLQQAQQDVKAKESLLSHQNELEGQRTKYLAFRAWTLRRDELASILTNAKKLLETIRDLTGVSVEKQELSKTLEAVESEWREANARNAAQAAKNIPVETKRKDLQLQLGVQTDRKSSLNLQLSTKPEGLFGEKCAACPAVSLWAEMPLNLANAKDEIKRLEKEIADLPKPVPLECLDEIEESGRLAREARVEVVRADEYLAREQEAMKEVEVAKASIASHQGKEIREVEDPEPLLVQNKTYLDGIYGAEGRFELATKATLILPDMLFNAAQAGDDAVDARVQHDNLKPAADAATATIANKTENQSTLEADLRKAELNDKTALENLESARRTHQALEIDIENREKCLEENIERASYLEELNQKIDALKELRFIFGPKGVRQILIDDAAPGLEDIAADIFEKVNGGTMQLRIATQSALRSGKTKETFDIMICDQRGERDIHRFSGGELQASLVLFRIAMAIWQGQVHGVRAECLIVDEAFDQKGLGQEWLLSILDYLGDKFEKLIVITHVPEVAQMLRSSIQMEKRGLAIVVKFIR